MLLEFYVEFIIGSRSLAPDMITELLGISPDESRARGSRFPDKGIPGINFWELHPSDKSASLEQQLTGLKQRLEPCADAVKRIAVDDDTWASIKIVRTFVKGKDETGVFGMFFDEDLIHFASSMNACINIPEYDGTKDNSIENRLWILGQRLMRRRRWLPTSKRRTMAARVRSTSDHE